MSTEIRGNVALVTGGNRGIGRAIVEAFLDQGASKVYAAVRDPASASVRDLVESSQGRVVPLEMDLSKPETVAAAAKTAGDVTVVVNNAGVLRNATPLADDVIEHMTFEMDVNVYGLLRVAKAFVPVIQANGGGALVQLNSVASLRNFSDFSTYSASKAASYSLTQGLRDSLRETGVRVLSVHPGPIATDMADAAGLTEMAEPPRVVADAIVSALATDEFHVFPDSMAREIWGAYEGFGRGVVESDMSEG